MSNVTIEPWDGRIPTFDEFAEQYRKPWRGNVFRRVASCFRVYGWVPGYDRRGFVRPQLSRIFFELRVRVPGPGGYFGFGVEKEATWCMPWNWLRLYYLARIIPLIDSLAKHDGKRAALYRKRLQDADDSAPPKTVLILNHTKHQPPPS